MFVCYMGIFSFHMDRCNEEVYKVGVNIGIRF